MSRRYKATMDLLDAAMELDVEGMRAALEAGADARYEPRDPEELSAASWVLLAQDMDHLDKHLVLERQLAALRLLGEYGGIKGRSASKALLTAASTDEDGSLTRLLLASGADATYITKDGYTLLHSAFNPTVVKMLLDAGAGKHVNTGRGGLMGTPLRMCALGCRTPGIVATAKLLLEAGADPNAADFNGQVPLFFAAGGEEPPFKLVRLLLAAGADPTVGTYSADKPILTHLQPTATSSAGDVKLWRLLARAAAWLRRRHLLLAVRGRAGDLATATAAAGPAAAPVGSAAAGAASERS